MNKTPTTPRRALTPAVLLAAALAAVALPAVATGPLADATVHAGGVDFLPMVAHRGGTITVTGPTMTYQRSFGAGERPSVGLFDPEGQLLPDGVYKYRLALTPDRWDARELRRAARQSGGSTADAWEDVTGTFALRNGLVVDSEVAEPRPARPATAYAGPTDLAGPARGDRIADDGDEAVARGFVPPAARIATAAPGGRTNPARSDAGAATQAPASRASSDDTPSAHRSYPTEGRNGRDQ